MNDDPIMIRDIPEDERPRERLLKEGPQALSNHELMAIILRTGTVHESVLQISQRLIRHFEGLRMLKEASIEELMQIKGIGKAKAVQIIATIELGRRFGKLHIHDNYTIHSPEEGANYVMEDMRFLTQEHFVAVYLNTKNQVIHKQTIFVGSLNASIVHPREVFKEGIKRSAASVICFHNHPSGNPTPSREDIEVTKRLVECGKLLGMEVLDHIVIGDNTYTSLKEKGFL